MAKRVRSKRSKLRRKSFKRNTFKKIKRIRRKNTRRCKNTRRRKTMRIRMMGGTPKMKEKHTEGQENRHSPNIDDTVTVSDSKLNKLYSELREKVPSSDHKLFIVIDKNNENNQRNAVNKSPRSLDDP